MAKKRTTPEKDIDRLEENLFLNEGSEIFDRDSFDDAFNRYLGYEMNNKQNVTLREKVWEKYALKRNVTKGVPRKVLTGKKEISKKDKFNVLGLTGNKLVYGKPKKTDSGVIYVDKKGNKITPVDEKDLFNVVGLQKGRVVYARQIETKRGPRYIDRRGRFVSVKG